MSFVKAIGWGAKAQLRFLQSTEAAAAHSRERDPPPALLRERLAEHKLMMAASLSPYGNRESSLLS